jgi:hypothetical protein
MPQLFRRETSLTVGTLRFTGLDLRFQVSKSLDREPNTAEIAVFNLSQSSRQQVEETEDQRVELRAGYVEDDGSAVIFAGDLRKASSTRDGADIVTVIEAGDGERAYRRGRVSRSFGAGTSLRSVIEGVGASLGLGIGNLSEVAAGAGFEGLGQVFSEGVVVSGSSREELSGLLDSAGIEWSVQDGNLQLLERGQALATTAVRLSPETGLIGSPSIDSEGLMKARALLIPDVFPGRKVEIVSEFVSGFYRVTKASYTGDTASTEWYVDIEGRAPSGS